jgi:hypothetical protein
VPSKRRLKDKARSHKKKRISTGSGDRALSTTSKSVTPTSIASDKAISRNSSLFSPLPNLLEAFLHSEEDDEGSHIHEIAQTGGSSLTHEQKSEIPKHVTSRSIISHALVYPSNQDGDPSITLPHFSTGGGPPIEPEAPAFQNKLKNFDDRRPHHDPRPTPPTSPTTRTLVNFLRQEIDAAQLAQEETASSTYSNTHQSAPAPALEASASSPISDESIYQTTPDMSNGHGHHQSTFFNPHADFDIDECSEDEKEYIYLYGERRNPAV